MNLFDQVLGLFNPAPKTRSPEEQRRVDEETAGLSLYFFPACPFCIKVRRRIRRLGLKIEERDIHRNRDWAQELGAGGGAVQVPCLRIESPGQKTAWLYESADIANYLEQRYG